LQAAEGERAKEIDGVIGTPLGLSECRDRASGGCSGRHDGFVVAAHPHQAFDVLARAVEAALESLEVAEWCEYPSRAPASARVND
jgi:hypothetical protein